MVEMLRAPLTGVVFQIITRPGARVSAGEVILILESMKMEIPIEAPRAAVVQAIQVVEGETVQEGHVLALLE